MKKERYYFNDVEIRKYLDYRAKKIHNALYNYEDRQVESYKSIYTAKLELLGLGEFIPLIKEDVRFQSLIYSLSELMTEYILMDDDDFVRRETLRCMGIIRELSDSIDSYLESD